MPTTVPPKAPPTFDRFVLFAIGLGVMLLAFKLAFPAPSFNDALLAIAP